MTKDGLNEATVLGPITRQQRARTAMPQSFQTLPEGQVPLLRGQDHLDFTDGTVGDGQLAAQLSSETVLRRLQTAPLFSWSDLGLGKFPWTSQNLTTRISANLGRMPESSGDLVDVLLGQPVVKALQLSHLTKGQPMIQPTNCMKVRLNTAMVDN